MTKKFILSLGGGLILSAAMMGVSFAQDTTTRTTTTTTQTQVTQNPDGTYTVIQYPVGKEVVVDLMPGSNFNGRGLARIMRTGNETMVNLDLSGLPADASNYYVYAVDPAGAVTLLGPANVANGMSKVTYRTPMDKFMLVLSPNEGLNTIATDTPVVFRSSVPKGYAVVNNMQSNPLAGEEKQVAGSAAVASTYDVPMLGIRGLERGETEIRINFSGELQGLKGKAYVNNKNPGLTKIKMRFDDMKMAPKDRRYVLWAVSPDKQYTKIGQVINTGRRQEAEIRGETALKDFGLFVTVEEKDVTTPTSTIYSPFRIG